MFKASGGILIPTSIAEICKKFQLIEEFLGSGNLRRGITFTDRKQSSILKISYITYLKMIRALGEEKDSEMTEDSVKICLYD